jgi:NAD(P)-dependent dehydrogenase (short-subunit alcohol dehydrogenase family)
MISEHVMKELKGRLAVVTGGGTGMGRELCILLAKAGCNIAMCDLSEENMAQTRRLCLEAAEAGLRVTTHRCDVSNEEEVLAFREAVLAGHETDHINLLFNNAGIGGGGSFLLDERAHWEKTFAVCWGGVYLCCRAFMPALVAADEGHLVNTSSVNGFWASIGPETPHTAYSAAKFAVKGFSEALITDLALNAPHVKVSVVMPGHIGTQIVANSMTVLGREPASLSTQEVDEIRRQMAGAGLPIGNLPDDAIRDLIAQQAQAFETEAPTTAASAAEIILDGVRKDSWRILVGEDAHVIDAEVRADPEQAYERSFTENLLARGHFAALVQTAGNSPINR